MSLPDLCLESLRAIKSNNQESLILLHLHQNIWKKQELNLKTQMTIDQLFEELLFQDFNFKSCHYFILIYPRILTRDELISRLLQNYNSNLILFVYIWLKTYPEDFKTRKIQDFLQEFLKIVNSRQIIEILESLNSEILNPKLPLRVNLPDWNNSDQLDLSDPIKLLESKGLIQQMCSIESSIFSKIKGRDYLLEDLNHVVRENVGYFNKLASWTITLILEQKTPKQRASIINKFRLIVVKLREINNFNSLMAISSGLSSVSITRLKRTSEYLKKNLEFDEIQELISSNSSWKNYRQELKEAKRPVIPFLGVFLRDFTVLGEFQDKNSHGMINTGKLFKMGEIISFLMDLKSDEFPRVNHTIFLNLLCQHVMYDSDSAYHQSCQLEP